MLHTWFLFFLFFCRHIGHIYDCNLAAKNFYLQMDPQLFTSWQNHLTLTVEQHKHCASVCALYSDCVLKFVLLFLCLALQASLNKLMETLGQSEPYFVKCIRSNAEKVQCAHFRPRPLSLFWFSFQSIFHFLWSLNFSKSVYHFSSLLSETSAACRFSFSCHSPHSLPGYLFSFPPPCGVLFLSCP